MYLKIILYLCQRISIVKLITWSNDEENNHFIAYINHADDDIWTIVCFPVEESGSGQLKGPSQDRVRTAAEDCEEGR